MEAVPKLPMIGFELKLSPEAISFQNLKQCIAEYYQEDPNSYSKEFTQLEQLRGVSVRPRIDLEYVSILKRYYAQLHSLQNRFPLSSENELLTFVWKEIYSGSSWQSSNIKYEMACILYNIASLHTQLGVEESRTNPESMKIACTHFQCAAWAYGQLKDSYSLVLKGDLSTEVLVFMQQICLAQAQECILEKSLGDNRKSNIIAKVTAQVVNFYNSAMSALFYQSEDCNIQDLVGSKQYKEWLKYIKFKVSYLSCILLLYQGQHSEEMKKMGERLTLYNAAVEKLEEAKKEAKGMPHQTTITEAITFTMDVVEGKRKAAKGENDFIYHEEVPDISTISAVQGANLVTGIGFDVSDAEVLGEDIFKRLVPMKTHENSSLYSEEKAMILRTLGAKVEEKDIELNSFMSSLNMDSLNSLNSIQSDRLPQGIVDRCAELSAKPDAIPNLVQSMSNLAETCAEVETMLNEIRMMLDEEAKLEKDYQKKMGQRPTSGHISELNREFSKYLDAHNKAGESNDTLRKAMELHVSNLRILSCPLSELQEKVPRFSDKIDEESIKDLRHLLKKVNEMKEQRVQLFTNLRDTVNSDDITSQLVAHGDKNVEELFQKELKKYSQTTALIEQNLEAQNNILTALTDTYAKYATLLKQINDMKIKKEQFFSSLIASYDVYEDLLLKSSKGLEFYKKLQGNVQKLISRVKGARDVQDEERQQMLKTIVPKLSSKSTVDAPTHPVSQNISSGGPKLKDYLKSGMFPNLNTGGAQTDKNVLPTRPTPVGQENNMMPDYASQKGQSYYPSATVGYTNPIYQNPHYSHSNLGYTQRKSDAMNYQYPPQQPSPALSQTSLNSEGSGSTKNYSATPMNSGTSGYPQQNQNSQYYNNPSSVPTTNYYMQSNTPTQQYQQYQNYGATTAPATSNPNPTQNQGNAYMQQNQAYNNPQQAQAYATTTASSNVSYTYYNTLTSPTQPTANYSFGSQTGTGTVSATNSNPQNYQYYQQYPQQQQQYQYPNQQQTQNSKINPTNYGNYGTTQVSGTTNQQGTFSNAQTTAYPQGNYQSPQGSYNYYQYQQQQTSNQSQPTQISQQSQISQQAQISQPTQTSQQAQFQTPGMTQQATTAQQPGVAQNYGMTQLPGMNQQGAVAQQQGFAQNPGMAQQATVAQQPGQFQQPAINQQGTVAQQQQPGQFQQPGMNQQGTVAQQTGYNYSNQIQYQPISGQQNYSCVTPTINTINAYSSAYNNVSGQTSLTQSNYKEIPNQQQTTTEIPQPTNNYNSVSDSNDTRGTPTLSHSQGQNGKTYSTQSQVQQITSPVETPKKERAIKSENIDLLSGIDFSIVSPSVDSVLVQPLQPQAAKPESLLTKEDEDVLSEILSPKLAACNIAPTDRKASADNVSIASDISSIDQNFDFDSVSLKNESVVEKVLVDPFDNPTVLKLFHKETTNLEKFCESLLIKTLNGVTPLDNKWKELQDLLVKDESHRSVSVAKLFPDKNRSIDYLPYDHARVLLPTSTDNYINAVYVKDLGPNCPTFILTQTPLNNTINDFWEMIWSQKSTTLICLHTPNEILDTFWPQEINKETVYGDFSITLIKQFDLSHCLEKYFKITKHGSDIVLNVSLLQIKTWKKSSADHILGVANNVITSFKQQNLDRKQNSPITINCLTGAERSAILTLAITSILATQSKRPVLLNVVDVWYRICSQRKGALNDVNIIKLSLQIILNNAHNILNKRGIMTSYQMKTAEKTPTSEVEEVVKDPLQELDPLWKFK